MKWMSKDASGVSSYERSFKYAYDALDRYTTSTYAERTTTGTGLFNNNIGGFNETVTYDVGENITTLGRNSSTQGTNSHVQIDTLTYGYDASSPYWLSKVTDGTDANHTGAGFKNLMNNTTYTYSHDSNGNMTIDPNKGLVLAYNDLNKTDKITMTAVAGRYISYTYDAGGTLIRKQTYDNNAPQNTTDYIDGFVYLNGALQYFAMPEGRVRNTGSALKPEYIITDQQGNARISFEESATAGVPVVRQENSYYPSGQIMPGSPVGTPTVDNKQLYNGGSEWQNDYGYGSLPDYYQTFYRNYDAALMQFIAVDPEPESAESMTTYQYANNNPVMLNDPSGNYAVNWRNTGLNTNFGDLLPSHDQLKAEIDALNSGGSLADFGGSNLVFGVGGPGGAYSAWSESDLIAAAKEGDAGAIQEYAYRNGTSVYNAGNRATNTPAYGDPNIANALLKSPQIVVGHRRLTYWTPSGPIVNEDFDPSRPTTMNNSPIELGLGFDKHYLDANQGGDYFQVNRGLAPSNFNFQPSFGVNWQAAGIKNVSVYLIMEKEPVIFNLEVGMPTKSKYLGRTISRTEAQLVSSKSYLQAMNMVNEEYSSGEISAFSIPSHVASWMEFFINENLGFSRGATVSNILGTNPGAPVRFADYTLTK